MTLSEIVSSQYKSTHTGEEIDEGIDKILSGEVARLTSAAHESAENAKQSEERAAEYAGQASESAADARDEAKEAVKAREAIENLSVTVTTKQPGESASVSKRVDSASRSVTLDFGIPAGERGETGPQGPEGERGPVGPPMQFVKVYASVAEMMADYDGTDVKENELVIIDTGDPEMEEDSRIYMKTADGWSYMADLSGKQGIQGPQGPRGLQGIQGPPGPVGPAGGDPYVIAVDHGYTGTEEQFYQNLISLQDGPFLPTAGGTVSGTFTVVSDETGEEKFFVGDKVRVGPRLITRNADVTEELNVGGGLNVGLDAKIKSSVTVGRVDPDGSRNGNLAVVGHSYLEGDVTVGRNINGVHVGRLIAVAGIDCLDSLMVDEKIYTKAGIIPEDTGSQPIGSRDNRFNTAFAKKFDASEHVATPKVRPPDGVYTLRFMCAGDADPEESDKPLPVKWGGTGATDGLSAALLRAGTFPTTAICARTGTDYSTARVRNIYAGTGAMTAKSSALSSGNIYLQYE